ncbi:phosphatidylglycerophosphatase B [bacterium YEK0313]|nr:phosphatidylglycerophosphatase B [bacterium YEK0313]
MGILRHWPAVRARVGRELGLVLALAVVAGGVLGFLALADLVVGGETAAFDAQVLMAFRQAGDAAVPLGAPWLPTVMRDITALGGTAVLSLIVLFTVVYLVLVRRPAAAAFVATAVLSGAGLSQVLKAFFDRARPDLVPNAPVELSASFPSGHSMVAAVTYLTLGVLLARIETDRRVRVFFPLVAVVLTVLVGVSRVYIGVHWPTDVLGGWLIGAAWAMACWGVVLWLQRGRSALAADG